MISLVPWIRQAEPDGFSAAFGQACALSARRFHQGFSAYAPSPLRSLDLLAGHLGLGKLWIKDESARLGLQAFKALGGSYAIGCALMARLQEPPEGMSVAYLRSPQVRERLGQLTFVTATDGNHGAGIAWTARELGHRALVYMPRGSAPQRVRTIQALGAEVRVTGVPYDDTARIAQGAAEAQGWLFAQDTTAPGYEQFPLDCMSGYTTLALEAYEALPQAPTHILVQAGAGTLAGAMAAYFGGVYRSQRPAFIVVEADSCNAIQRSAQARDGTLRKAEGDLSTIMAGLSVGEVCTVGWRALREGADCFAAIGDREAAAGMRVLGAPLPGDPRVEAGESGAAGLALLYALMREDRYADDRRMLGLDGSSRVLCLNTEGATDGENYRRIVWEGAYGG
ncbi:MAG: diaminopropionate ammonia-lyase [Christensenellales bacterium]